ncbi:hypothetical protein CHS0354_016711, partial [Potamilus streckersoni]
GHIMCMRNTFDGDIKFLSDRSLGKRNRTLIISQTICYHLDMQHIYKIEGHQ